MTRRALNNGQPVYLDTSMDRIEIEEKYREADLFCDCSARLHLVNGKKKSPHFRHENDANCCYEAPEIEESEEHRFLKSLIAELLSLEGFDPALERPFDMDWRPKGRRADVSVELNNDENDIYVFEAQISRISFAEVRERCRDYRKAGVSGVFWAIDPRQQNDYLIERIERKGAQVIETRVDGNDLKNREDGKALEDLITRLPHIMLNQIQEDPSNRIARPDRAAEILYGDASQSARCYAPDLGITEGFEGGPVVTSYRGLMEEKGEALSNLEQERAESEKKDRLLERLQEKVGYLYRELERKSDTYTALKTWGKEKDPGDRIGFGIGQIDDKKLEVGQLRTMFEQMED